MFFNRSPFKHALYQINDRNLINFRLSFHDVILKYDRIKSAFLRRAINSYDTFDFSLFCRSADVGKILKLKFPDCSGISFNPDEFLRRCYNAIRPRRTNSYRTWCRLRTRSRTRSSARQMIRLDDGWKWSSDADASQRCSSIVIRGHFYVTGKPLFRMWQQVSSLCRSSHIETEDPDWKTSAYSTERNAAV